MIGIIGRKKGMASVFDSNGKNIAVTILEAGPCPVLQKKTVESDGYNAIQIGFEQIRAKRVTKPLMGHFKKANVQPHRVLRELSNFEGDVNVGDFLKVDLFKAGDKVIVSGLSKGHGFTGVIKRHNFHRPNQSHGTHEAFRGGGSVGQASSPARVWPGMKMPGRHGGGQISVKNLSVVKVDAELGLIMIKGAVPGANGGYIMIRKQG